MHAQYQQHKPCILGVEIKKPRSQPHMPRHASFILLPSPNPSFLVETEEPRSQPQMPRHASLILQTRHPERGLAWRFARQRACQTSATHAGACV
jgi:hypothetical protein